MAASPLLWTPYCGPGPVPTELLARWNLDSVLLAALTLCVVAWAMGVRPGADRRGRLAFWGAMGVLLVAFVSPLCALSSALFAARVGHHLLLVLAAAPLLALALPPPPAWLRRALPLAVVLHAVAVWLWHSPVAYGWALGDTGIYWLMQASLLATGVVFWAGLRGASAPSAVAALLATMVQMGLLGALITFASAPLYAPHFATTAAWGLSALEDQQLAGLIMWVPAAGAYLAAALAVLARWIGPEPRAAAAP